jgi:ABC-type dipeptide/oligopeptide/nickel transport system permease component
MEPESEIKPPDIKGLAPIEPRLDSLANVSHQKGDVPLITLPRDRVEAMLSPVSSLSSNFFTLMIGIALAIFMALKSGGVQADWVRTFWLAFWFSLILIVFFGIFTGAQEWKKHQFRKEIRKLPSTPVN